VVPDVDVDATIVVTHSEKRRRRQCYSFGFHSLDTVALMAS